MSQKSLSPEERQQAEGMLTSSYAGFERSVAGVGDDICGRKSPAGDWSVLDIVEHLAIVEVFTLRSIRTRILEGTPVAANPERDATIARMVEMGAHKVVSPEPVRPKGRYKTIEEAVEAFQRARQKTIEYVRDTEDPIRERALPHPALGALDGYQWIVFLAAHSARHARQIETVRAALVTSG